MKNNQPVTDNQVSLTDGSVLVSKTDLKGVITYCNRDFIEISGFSQEELLGKSNNIIRHPDTPPAVFANMWKTIKSGKPWTGVVKNRCKNGDFYWVQANITPVTELGKITEYMSVRSNPTDAQIKQAETLYEAIANKNVSVNALSGHFIHRAINSLSIQSSLILFFTFLAMTYSIIGAATFVEMPDEYVLSILGVSLLICSFFGIRFFSYISGINYLRRRLLHINEGHYFDWIMTDRRDELGDLMLAIKSMQIKLGFELMDAKRHAEESRQIQVALNKVNSPIMMADKDYNIFYMNEAVETLFTAAGNDLRKELPDFDEHHLLGSCIDQFHKDPMHQRRLLDALEKPYTGQFEIGGRTLQVVANPIYDDSSHRRLATAVEWHDRTSEVLVEREIDGIVSAVRRGDLKHRIEPENKQGFLATLSLGINAMIDVLDHAFKDIADVMSEVAKGDLTREITSDYEGTFNDVKLDINQTIAKLRCTIAEMHEAASLVSNSSEEIFQGNSELSSRTENQASALQETASSMEEITGTVKNNADNAHRASLLSSNAREKAETGGAVVNDAVNAMDAINRSSNKIAEIISVIDDIAFQTNLLALNASVEAARAGEQGRSFAVVASEVGNLAGRSASAAKEIKALIEDSVEKVRTGTSLVNQSGDTLTEILSGIQEVNDVVEEISEASKEQSQGIEQVNAAITSLDEVTQQNAALAEEAYAASDSLSGKAQHMNKLLTFFTIGEIENNSINAEPKPDISPEERSEDSQSPPMNVTPEKPSIPAMSSTNSNLAQDLWTEF